MKCLTLLELVDCGELCPEHSSPLPQSPSLGIAPTLLGQFNLEYTSLHTVDNTHTFFRICNILFLLYNMLERGVIDIKV